MAAGSDFSSGDAKTSFHALPRRRAYEEILLQIERAIAVGELSPGDRLPSERELAETFGVSRASVREALRVLETLGVLTARRGNGAESGSLVTDRASADLATALRFYTVLGQIPTLDFVDVRSALEGESAARAARLPDAPTEQLRALVDRMPETGTILAYHELDTEFHLELAQDPERARNAVQAHILRFYRELFADDPALLEYPPPARSGTPPSGGDG